MKIVFILTFLFLVHVNADDSGKLVFDARESWKKYPPYNFPMSDFCKNSLARTCLERPVVPEEYISKLKVELGDKQKLPKYEAMIELFSKGGYRALDTEYYCRLFRCFAASKSYKDAVGKKLEEQFKCDQIKDSIKKIDCELALRKKQNEIVDDFQRADPNLAEGFLQTELNVSDAINRNEDLTNRNCGVICQSKKLIEGTR